MRIDQNIWPIASLLFLSTYGLAYWQGISLFYYLPIGGNFVMGLEMPSDGPAMGWYGLISLAVLVALTAPVVAVVTRRARIELSSGIYWLLPVVILILIVIHEWHWVTQ